MGLGIKSMHLALELYRNNYFKDSKSVIDMGDQDLHIDYDTLVKELNFIDISEFEKKYDRIKYFPERPRVSSSTFWDSLGFKICDRLDIEKIERSGEDICNNFLKVDLNFPIENQTIFEKYDLVTDFGNNEHPFNVIESYNSMHKLCKKFGLMLIHQNIFGGNGFFNFDISFFESIAAVNNYSILYSCYTFDKKGKYFSIPIDEDLLKCINLNEIKDIGVFYLFKKNNDKKFVFPYQGIGSSIERNEVFKSQINKQNIFPERTYLPKSLKNISGRLFIKYIKEKIFKK